MRIFHICQFKINYSNGIQATVWELSKAQAELGNSVFIFSLGRKPKKNEVEEAKTHGIILLGSRENFLRGESLSNMVLLLSEEDETITHFHSAFIPGHDHLAYVLFKKKIPYVITSHGNLGPLELKRKKLKKFLYMKFVFKKTMARASLLIGVSQTEVEVIRGHVNHPNIQFLGNSVDPTGLIELPLRNENGGDKGISLGKSDITHKGYDLMFSVSKEFSDGVDYYVVPYRHMGRYDEFLELLNLHQNDHSVRVHDPIYGDDKIKALALANCFLHLARWEVFGMVLIEAALAGLPIILSRSCDLAPEIESAAAGLVVDLNDNDMAGKIRSYLNSLAFREAGKKAREWARKHYTSEPVAKRSIELYQEALWRASS